MKHLIILYPIYLVLLLYFLFFDENSLSTALNKAQSELLLDALSFWFDERIQGSYIFINPHYALSIDKSCNGMVSILIFIASILSYRAKVLYRLFFALLGYLVLSSINLLRIVWVTYMVIVDQGNFSWSHDYLGNAVLVIVGLALFAAYTHFARGKN